MNYISKHYIPGKKTAIKTDNGLFHPSFLTPQLKGPWSVMTILFDHCDVVLYDQIIS